MSRGPSWFLLAGDPVRASVAGALPSLVELVEGRLVATTDFRRIYATVLEGWLAVAR